MTSSVNSIRTAVAAAIAAAALLTSASLPVQAEYQLARHVKKKFTKAPNYQRVPHRKRSLAFALLLKCKPAWVQGGFRPTVINSTGRTLGVGRNIQWRVFANGGVVYTGTLTLLSPLHAGNYRQLMGPIQGKFSCRASVFAA